MKQEIITKLEAFDTIIIHRHSRPDGDAIGSQIGLKQIIITNYPNKAVYTVGDESGRFKFLGEMDIIKDELYNDALVIVLDTADNLLISDERYQNGKFLIKIDHHISTNDYGDINLVDTSYESCAGLIADFAFSNNLVVNKEAAVALYTGMVTDSGRFRYNSTTPKTFATASKLLATGIDISYIYNNLYVEELDNVKARAYFMLNFEVTADNVAYMKNTIEDIEKLNLDFFTVSRGMVNTMAGIRGINVWANFTEDKENNVIVAELRSNRYNINQIAVKYGGGGHLMASGASLASWDDVDLMIHDLNELVRREKNV